MAKGRVRNRLELRANIEAAERRERGEDEREEDEEEEAGASTEEAEAEEDEGEEEEAEAAPKKKKAAPKTAKPRTRAPKHVRLKMVWGVFNNSHQRVATFEYPKRKDAEEHAAKLAADKKSTFFVQPVKEPLEEKKE
jgi:cobalamin biosynthesis protein CobT